MLFLTNRMFKEGIKGQLNRNVTFDLDNNSPANAAFFCERQGANQYIEVGSKSFFDKLREMKVSQILIYIHGFSNLPEDSIFQTTETLQYQLDNYEKGMTLVVPIIWPCDNDLGVVNDYWDDQMSADASGISIARILCKFMEWSNLHAKDTSCLKHINILSHSMGNRVLSKGLQKWHEYFRPQGLPQIFRNIFMAAADLVNETFEPGEEGNIIPQTARNVCVYYAGDDWALRSSKVMNITNQITSRRLGHTGPEDPHKIPKNVYSFDCDDFNNEYDYPVGHSYFLTENNKKDGKAGALLSHMCTTLKTGRVEVVEPANHVIYREAILRIT